MWTMFTQKNTYARVAGLAIVALIMFAAMRTDFPGLDSEGARVLQRLTLIMGLGCMAALVAAGWIARQAEQVLEQLDRWLMAGRRRPLLLLSALILAYIVVWDGITFLRHYFFHSSFDLALWDHLIWNTAHGRLFDGSIEVTTFLADHVGVYVPLLSLLYLLVPSPYTLLGAQSCILGLCAVPLYRLARRRLQSPAAAIAVAACALLYPPLGFVNRFDFHPEIFALPFLVAAYERLDAADLRGASVWMGLALLAKEDVGFTVAALGLFAAVVLKRYRFGLTWAVVSPVYSLIAMFIVIPALRGVPSDTLVRYEWMGSTPQAILTTLLSRPGLVAQYVVTAPHLLTLLQLLAPLAFLPLAGLPALLVALPALAINFGAVYAPQGTIYWVYMYTAIPSLYVAAVYGLQRLSSRSTRRLPPTVTPRRMMGFLLVALVLSTIGSWVYQNPITGHTILDPELAQTPSTGVIGGTAKGPSLTLPNDAAVRDGLRHVPPAAYVLTTNQYGAHLAEGRRLTLLRTPPEPVVPLEAQAIFLNVWDLRSSLGCEGFHRLLGLAAQAGFGITFYRDGVLLAERDSGDRQQLRQLVAGWPGCG